MRVVMINIIIFDLLPCCQQRFPGLQDDRPWSASEYGKCVLSFCSGAANLSWVGASVGPNRGSSVITWVFSIFCLLLLFTAAAIIWLLVVVLLRQFQ